MRTPVKRSQPIPAASAKHPMKLPGMRWVPSIALSPANLLQLQRAAGNQALIELLKRYADPSSGELTRLKTYRAARKDGIVPVPGTDHEAIMKSQDPHYGDWHFHFVADERGGSMAMYWITLNQYKNRQRHILIDAATSRPLEVTGGDLDEGDRKLLSDWAEQLLIEQIAAQAPMPPMPEASKPPNPEEGKEEDLLSAFLADDGEDEGSGLGAAIAGAAAAVGNKSGSKGKAAPNSAGPGGSAAGK